MCRGNRLLADFVVGTEARPSLPEVVEEHLTRTTDGLWVVWAYKVATQMGHLFVPLVGGPAYPADARAECLFNSVRRLHDVPDPNCGCGFHALSSRQLPGLGGGRGFSILTVALSGRVLAFQWGGGGVLWRAERQTVARVQQPAQIERAEYLASVMNPFDRLAGRVHLRRRHHPGDPGGRTVGLHPVGPSDSGPIRLDLPVSPPVLPLCRDDAGWCVAGSTIEHSPASLMLV